jgi:hypothetical protein
MIIEQQQVDRKFGRIRACSEGEEVLTPRRKREVTREYVFFLPDFKALFY